MTLNQKYYGGAVAVILATLTGIIVAYPHLPATVPLHWNARGQVDNWGPKWNLLVFGPGLMTFVVLMFSALRWLSPKKFDVDSFRATYLYIMIVTISLLAYVQILIVLWSLGMSLDMSRAIEGGVCLLVALMGNVMGKVRRNFFVGIRTPWTLASERVWNATHRLAAKTFFAGGLLGLIAVVLRTPFWAPITLILIAVVAPAAYSLILYKQWDRQGEL